MTDRQLISQWMLALSERARDEALASDGFNKPLWDKAFMFQYASFGRFDAIKTFQGRA